MQRALVCGACLLLAASFEAPALGESASAKPRRTERVLLFADRDDDDANGVADADQVELKGSALADVRWIRLEQPPKRRERSAILSPIARWVLDSRGLAPGASLPARATRVGLQGLGPGRSTVLVGERAWDVSVVEWSAVDAQGGRVDLARSHASISRVLPAFLANDPAGASDQDALRWIAIGDPDSVPESVEIDSLDPSGARLDGLSPVELWELPCPAQVEKNLVCRGTALIRATVDRIDRAHPESAGRSLRAEVGGKLVVRVAGEKASSIRVGGPRRTALGAIDRFRGRLRVHVLRITPGGPPAVGDTSDRALELVRAEVDTANLLWGQCGIHFGAVKDLWIRMQDPPPAHLVAVGCGLGLPASGGKIRLRVGKKSLEVPTVQGESPLTVASRLADVLRSKGLGAIVSRNPRIEPGALATADVLVRQGDALAEVEPDSDSDGNAPISSDPSLSVCIGSVDFAEGLSHFADHDAPAGTLEERTLVKAYADRDPSTIEVFVIPSFSSRSRVGESFLDSPGSAIQNTVIVDRAAIRAGAHSHVLSHELGHVLLDMPGHPDDYGVDQPSFLMDADASDPSIFGPRRLSVSECERAIRQRGPKAPAPLLEHWPLYSPPKSPLNRARFKSR